MNYSSINDTFDLDNNYYNIINEENNNQNNNQDENNQDVDASKLIKDYNNINNTLKLNINNINKLESERKEILNYKSNIFSKHQDIMIKLYNNQIGEMVELNDCIIKYIDLLKIYIDKWNIEYYNKKKYNIESDIRKQEEQLTAYRKLFINTTKEIIKTEKINKNICPICFENEINMCSVPCGHTCCQECLNQSIIYNNSRVTKCLNCRNPVNDYIRFYIQL